MKIKPIATGLIAIFAPVVIVASVFAAGNSLTSKDGMTLYTFDRDGNGVSNCNGACSAQWPPYTAGNGAQAKGGYGIIIRTDGTKQWTYNSKPLYHFSGDSKAGDANGDGIGGVWHMATKSNYSYAY